MPPHHNLACIYNKNTIEVDNTVMHYGCLIGLEDGNPFRNIIHLIFVLTFTIFIPILICSLLVICFTCKKFEMSNDTGDQYERLDRIGLPANYKWYKIYAAFRYSFYIRVMIQILMTVVLISHPLCKLISLFLNFHVILMFKYFIVFDGNGTTLEESAFIFISPLIFIATVVTVWVFSMKFDKSLPDKYYSVEFFSGVTSDRNE